MPQRKSIRNRRLPVNGDFEAGAKVPTLPEANTNANAIVNANANAIDHTNANTIVNANSSAIDDTNTNTSVNTNPLAIDLVVLSLIAAGTVIVTAYWVYVAIAFGYTLRRFLNVKKYESAMCSQLNAEGTYQYDIQHLTAPITIQCAARTCQICFGNPRLKQRLLELKNEFPKNMEHVAEYVSKEYEDHFCTPSRSPKRPLILWLGGVEGSEQLVKKLASRVAKVLMPRGNYDLGKFSQHYDDYDDTLKEFVRKTAINCPYPVFTVPILELPIARMYDFHHLCDENSALVPLATYIFTLIRPEKVSFRDLVKKAFDPDDSRSRIAPALRARVFPGGLQDTPDVISETDQQTLSKSQETLYDELDVYGLRIHQTRLIRGGLNSYNVCDVQGKSLSGYGIYGKEILKFFKMQRMSKLLGESGRGC